MMVWAGGATRFGTKDTFKKQNGESDGEPAATGRYTYSPTRVIVVNDRTISYEKRGGIRVVR